jgi:hypothetical protein
LRSVQWKSEPLQVSKRSGCVSSVFSTGAKSSMRY